MLVVADSSPLILLSRIGRLALLEQLYGSIVVPGAVYTEVVEHAPDLPGSRELKLAPWVEVWPHAVETPLFHSLAGSLGAGEAAALALAVVQEADWVLIDERQGRLTAKRLGLSTKGTLGVLVQAKKAGHLERLAPIVTELAHKGARFAPWLLAEVLRSAGELPDASA